ncbi:hypothetical protein ElyMa_002381100 [Elysia marginata]|uniref:Transmembrane protein n=1 Tax=Elysia marginata TaxID=1093978 RepID=A0AAV4GC29_9GAST|nr:hypothetical protein ElyMa_002381100 [Elysia marginata]
MLVTASLHIFSMCMAQIHALTIPFSIGVTVVVVVIIVVIVVVVVVVAAAAAAAAVVVVVEIIKAFTIFTQIKVRS